MNILIFENDLHDLKNIKSCIENYFYSNEIECNIDVCKNEKNLFSIINQYDILFLDIELGNLNGIEIGKELRKNKVDCEIIIVSNYKEYLIDGYKIDAKRYFLKPIHQEEFNIEMDTVIQEINKKNEGFFDEKISTSKIIFDNIIYVEFVNRKSEIHLLNGQTLFSSYPLKYWEELLKHKSFASSHRSYLINLKHVSSIEDKYIVVCNNEKIPLSRNNKKEFKNKYIKALHLFI